VRVRLIARTAAVPAAVVTIALILASASARDSETIRGSLAADAAKSRPKRVRLRLRSIDQSDIELTCPVNRSAWACSVPAGTFDVEVRVPGFAPLYRWNVVSENAAADFGAMQFARGGGIEGKVVESGLPASAVALELTPETALSGDAARRNGFRTERTVSRRDGHFAFADVADGVYTLTCEKPGFSTVSRNGIRVEAGHVRELGNFAIGAVSSLSLFVTPPVDFGGAPWQVRLNRRRGTSLYEELARSGKASPAGMWAAGALDAATYRIEILTSRGDRVLSRSIELPRDRTVNVAIEAIPIDGTLTIGNKPAAGRVALVWSDGSKLSFAAGTNGEFSGVVPHEGTWRVFVRLSDPPLELRAPDTEVARRPTSDRAVVRVDLGGSSVEGSVFDERGNQVAAGVLLFRERTLLVSARTGPDGHYRIIGLEKGPVELLANVGKASSGYVPATIPKDEAATIDLSVKPSRTVTGHVRDTAGNPVIGAVLHYTSGGYPQQTISGLDGDFALTLPGTAPQASILVVAAGLPRKLLTYVIQPDAPNLEIALGASAGSMQIKLNTAPPWPTVTSDGVNFFPLLNFFSPHAGGPPAEFQPGGFAIDVEPGAYTVCPEDHLGTECATKNLQAGAAVAYSWSDKGWR
jgi:hypothetical protein